MPTIPPLHVHAPLHEMNPTGRFSERAEDYVRFRPSYPVAAVDTVLAGLGDPASLTAADIGAGTGISARLLANRGVKVIAIEPNRAMRDVAEPHPLVVFREGTAEATGLDDTSVDLAFAAQAFHWFRADEALREFARILRPGARLALVWNRRDGEDPFTTGYRAALHEVGVESRVEQMEFDPGLIERSEFFSRFRHCEFPNQQHLDLEGLVGRAMSASYVPNTGPAATKIVALLHALHARHADAEGRVTLLYATEVYLADRTGERPPSRSSH